MKNKPISILAGIVLFCTTAGCLTKSGKYDEADFVKFLQKYETETAVLETGFNLATFQASVSGRQTDYKKATSLEISLSRIYSDRNSFAMLSELRKTGGLSDSLLNRQLDVLYYMCLPYQIDENKQVKLIMGKTQVEQIFSTYRPLVDGREMSDYKIDKILGSSTDTALLRKTWEASKEVGGEIAQTMIEIVKLRNEAAQELGYPEYYSMNLAMNHQDFETIDAIFDTLAHLTDATYRILKDSIDDYLSLLHHIDKSELMPWHYQNRFFQQAPNMYQVNQDAFYANKNIEEVASEYFESIGLPIEEILAHSDLYPNQGKAQLPYSVDIDRKGDVRILSNLESSDAWMSSLMYEAGFSVYLKNIDTELPYTLHRPSHFFTNDAVAIMFSRFTYSPQWLQQVMNVSEEDISEIEANNQRILRMEKLIFSRWAQVMYRFEKELYKNPEQDLNALWWDLVEKYQLIKKPEGRNSPDWAAKAHIVTMPCSYHNYLLGELYASQLYTTINKELGYPENSVTEIWYNKPEAGRFLQNKVFRPGLSMYWNELIEYSTGKSLDPIFFSEQLQ